MNIQFYHNDQIDKDEWDHHISQCPNRLIYARSFYLDKMCPGWGCLVDEKRDYLMPLPMGEKAGITYSYQPLFTQQLGVFIKNADRENVVQLFLDKAATLCRDIELYLNYANPVMGAISRCNLVLDLNQPFTELSKNFRKDLTIRPKKAGLKYGESALDEVFHFYRKYVLTKNKLRIEPALQSFETLSLELFEKKQAFIRRVTNLQGDTLSTALFLTDDNRIYYVMAANSPEGRKWSANALLLYEALSEFSGQEKIFDFEGSEIPGVRFFFEKFAPAEQPYYHYKAGNLNIAQRAAIAATRKVRYYLNG